MKKIERDGMVAVLVSHGFGAGWSTWNSEHRETLCMDAEIVQAVLDGDKAKAVEIDEYDGSETLHVIGDHGYMVA